MHRIFLQEIKINQVPNLTSTLTAKFSPTLRGEKGKAEDELIVHHPDFAVRRKIGLELLTLHPKRNNKIIQSHIFPQFSFHSFIPAFFVSKFECHCVNCVHCIYYAHSLS